jgi:hypothetical protein
MIIKESRERAHATGFVHRISFEPATRPKFHTRAQEPSGAGAVIDGNVTQECKQEPEQTGEWNMATPQGEYRANRTANRAIVRLRPALVAAMLAAGTAASFVIIDGNFAPAIAQERVSVSADFRTALEPYGRWERLARWGDVWIPNDRPRGWRPYTVGRWDYTDDWGWYWASDQDEDAWGWIVYHYGRWVFDRDFGWAWLPGNQWGPGFVSWRRGTQYVGWAPLPPDDIVATYDEQPDVWAFVAARDFLAPRLFSVILPERESTVFIRDTVVVNRDVEFRDRGFAVNPGIAPGIIAAAVGRPIRAFDVRPRVLAGTSVRIDNAIEVRANELARSRESFRESLRETQREFRPEARVPPPQALGRNERGRLGEVPPRAAERLQGGAQGRVGEEQRAPQNVQPGPNAPRPGTQGLGNREERNLPPNRAQEQLRQPQPEPQNRATQEQQRLQQQQNRATQEQQRLQQEQQRQQQNRTTGEQLRQQQEQNRAQEQLRQQQNRAVQGPRERPSTEGVAPRGGQAGPQPQAQPRPQPQAQPRAPEQVQRTQPQPQQVQPPVQRAPQEPPRTEGRGAGPAPGGPPASGGAPQRGRRPGEP